MEVKRRSSSKTRKMMMETKESLSTASKTKMVDLFQTSSHKLRFNILWLILIKLRNHCKIRSKSVNKKKTKLEKFLNKFSHLRQKKKLKTLRLSAKRKRKLSNKVISHLQMRPKIRRKRKPGRRTRIDNR